MNAIRSRVPAAEYHALPGVSITRLKEIARSPLHYKHLLEHPRDTEPMRLGTAAHTAALEPERFDSQFAVWGERTPGGRMRPRNGNDWEEFCVSAYPRTVITQEQEWLAKDIAAAVRSNPNAMRYLDSGWGEPEVTIQWRLAGAMVRECRGRVDWITREGRRLQPVLVGLKTARDCRHFVFGSQAAKLGYHLQWAWYHDGYKVITGLEPKMVEIVVESSPPHAVAVYRIPGDVIDHGREEYRRAMEILARCERVGSFPGPQEEEEELTLPSWAYPGSAHTDEPSDPWQ